MPLCVLKSMNLDSCLYMLLCILQCKTQLFCLWVPSRIKKHMPRRLQPAESSPPKQWFETKPGAPTSSSTSTITTFLACLQRQLFTGLSYCHELGIGAIFFHQLVWPSPTSNQLHHAQPTPIPKHASNSFATPYASSEWAKLLASLYNWRFCWKSGEVSLT